MNTPDPRLYLLHGMKRSGNHAVINWLLPQTGCTHFNNFIPIGKVLRGSPIPAATDLDIWRDKQAVRTGERPDHLLVSLEDHDLRTQPFRNIRIPITRLLVLRDPRQLFSSRIRKASKVEMPAYPRTNNAVMQRAIRLWKQHASCYLGELDCYPERVAILFDAWFSDPAYRAAISRTLGVPFSDEGFNTVGAEGGGSSFDGIGFDGRPHLMAVTDRVSALDQAERDLLDELFADNELEELCNRVLQSAPLARLTI